MGLPLGPTFTNIFMCFHESSWISDCPTEFCLVFYRQYIDDTFLLFHCQEHSTLFLNYLNSKPSNINVTFEHESCITLQFLDCIVDKINNKFECSVYRKGSFTGLGMSYFSNCAFKFKLNCILTLLLLAYRVCSNFNYLHMLFTFLREYFWLNGYCSGFVERQICTFLGDKLDTITDVLADSSNDKPLYLSFPYFGPIAEKLKTEVLFLLAKYYRGKKVPGHSC